MEQIVEVLREARLTAEAFGFEKLEIYGIFCVILGFWRLPVLLKHRREMSAISSDFAIKSKKLDAKIEDQRSKRARKIKREKK